MPDERKFLTQRKVGILIPHQNTAKVRMSFKFDAEHVVGLALVPVRSSPKGQRPLAWWSSISLAQALATRT